MNSPLLFLGDIGGSEIMLIMVVILIFFGANKIPELARGLGKGIREFKDASSEIRNEFEKVGQAPPPQPYQQPAPTPYANPTPAYEATLTDAPAVQHHDTPLPGNPVVVGTPLADSSTDGTASAAPAYGTPGAARPRLDQTHSSEA